MPTTSELNSAQAPAHTLYGGPLSLYTGKVRSYLRKQRIPFVEVSAGSARYTRDIAPVIGRRIFPVLETPTGQIIQDGAEIIHYFERGEGQAHRHFPSYPETPTHLAVSHLFELFGGEGLLRPAMHYRWNFDSQNLEFLRSEFGVLVPPSLPPDRAAQIFDRGSGRMRQAAVGFGVTAESIPTIETAFGEWLDLFSRHLENQPYLLGWRPTLGDYGLMAAMWAHLYRDPAPSQLIKQRAPRVGRWVERMSTSEPYEHEYEPREDQINRLFADDEIPQTLQAMMRYVAVEWLPEIVAHVDFANEWLAARPDLAAGTNGLDDPAARAIGSATFTWRSQELETWVMPYRFWLLQHLHDDLADFSEDQQANVRSTFRKTGVESLLDLRTLRRVRRDHHLEVWGT